jgi:hypothetical protein
MQIGCQSEIGSQIEDEIVSQTLHNFQVSWP